MDTKVVSIAECNVSIAFQISYNCVNCNRLIIVFIYQAETYVLFVVKKYEKSIYLAQVGTIINDIV